LTRSSRGRLGLNPSSAKGLISEARGGRLGRRPPALSPVRSGAGACTFGLMKEELAQRSEEGLYVRLLWSRRDNRLAVEVSDVRSGRHFELEAPRDRALDVFYHPYAYASTLGAC
jgi:hypothetical protein